MGTFFQRYRLIIRGLLSLKAIETKLLTADRTEKLHCYLCAGSGPGICRLAGYEEFGELWVCPACWEIHPIDGCQSKESEDEESRES